MTAQIKTTGTNEFGSSEVINVRESYKDVLRQMQEYEMIEVTRKAGNMDDHVVSINRDHIIDVSPYGDERGTHVKGGGE